MNKKNIILSLSLLLTLTSCRVVSTKNYKNEVTKVEFYTKLEEGLKAYDMEDIPSYELEYYVKNNYKVVEYYKVSNRTINSSDSYNSDVTYKYDSTTKVIEIRESTRENITDSEGSIVENKTTHMHYQNAEGGSYYIDMVDSDYSFENDYTYEDFAPFMQYIAYDTSLLKYEAYSDEKKYYVDKNVYTMAIENKNEDGENKTEKKIIVQFNLKKKGLTFSITHKIKKTIVDGDNTKTENTNDKENYTLKFKKISMKQQDIEKFYFHD